MIKRLYPLLSVLYGAFLALLITTPYWPASVWWLANFLQMAPLWFYLVPFAPLLVGGLRYQRRKMLAVQSVLILIFIFTIAGFKLNMPGSSPVGPGSKIRFLTVNVGERSDPGRLLDFIKKANPDVIAFQEIDSDYQNFLTMNFDARLWDMNFRQGFGVLSKMKIVEVDVRDRRFLNGWGGMIGRYVLKNGDGFLNLFNVHLKTPRGGIESILDSFTEGIATMKRVTGLQNVESSIASTWVASHQNAVVAGDFNMPEINPVYKKYWKSFQNAFSSKGMFLGYTKHTRWHGARIDHILCDAQWEVVNSFVGPDFGGDHHPLVADLVLIGAGVPGDRDTPSDHKTEVASCEGCLVCENFDSSPGPWAATEAAELMIDYKNVYKNSNSLKINSTSLLEPSGAGIRIDPWNIETYPRVHFAYLIPTGHPVRLRVKTNLGDWICIGATENVRAQDVRSKIFYPLRDDNMWHEVDIDIRKAVQSVLSAMKDVAEFQILIEADGTLPRALWIDDFRIEK